MTQKKTEGRPNIVNSHTPSTLLLRKPCYHGEELKTGGHLTFFRARERFNRDRKNDTKRQQTFDAFSNLSGFVWTGLSITEAKPCPEGVRYQNESYLKNKSPTTKTFQFKTHTKSL